MKYDIEVKINTSRRRPIILVFYHNRVLIEFPKEEQNTPENVQSILNEYGDWIASKVKLHKTSTLEIVHKTYDFVSGTSIFIKGDKYTLKIIPVKNALEEACFIENKILICKIRKTTKEKVREVIKKFLLPKSEELIKSKVLDRAKGLGIVYDKVFLKEYKSSWGHVRDNDLYFDWRVIFLKEVIINYLVVHEVLHFKYRNHGDDFYEQLKALVPNYLEIEKKLKEQRYLIYRF